MTPKILLCRILSNDLPPRHRRGQTERNLDFMLRHETAEEGWDRLWILNRIFDRSAEARLLRMLERRRQRFERMPFDRREYRMLPDDEARTNYFGNINAARNLALARGRERGYDWILPFDGGVFVSRAAASSISSAARSRSVAKYLVVPMLRCFENARLLPLLSAAAPPEIEVRAAEAAGFAAAEPQLAFRSDAACRFDESFPYGHLDKIELLWRLGVSGAWDGWYPELRQKALAARNGDFGRTAHAGHVFRLSSGNARAERDGAARGLARYYACERARDVIAWGPRAGAAVYAARRAADGARRWASVLRRRIPLK